MSIVKFKNFGGIQPKVAPKLLGDYIAQTCENVNLAAGRLEPWKIPLTHQAIAASRQTIYPWYRNSATEWLTWAGIVDVVQSPVAEDTYSRIYYTGDGAPKIRGWSGGAAVVKAMSRDTATAPRATPTSLTANASIDFEKGTGLTCSVAVATTGYGYTNNYTDTGSFVSGSYDKDRTKVTLIFAIPGRTCTTMTKAGMSQGSTVSISKTRTLRVGAFGNIVSNGNSVNVTGILTATQSSGWISNFNPVFSDTYVNYGTNLSPVIQWFTAISYNSYLATIVLDLAWVSATGTGEDVKYCYYVQTLVDSWGMEGPASTVSNSATLAPGQKMVLSNFGSGGTSTKRRFYRSAAGSTEDHFYYLAEIDVGTTTYTDTKSDAELGEELPLFENPPDGMTGIVMLPGGFTAAFLGREVLFSSPYYPWSYPSEYRITVDFDIIGLGVAGNDLYVMTKGNPYMVTGYHPESMTVSKLPLAQSCVAKRSIATMKNTILYASPDGLVGITAGTGSLLTANFYSKDDWSALTPSGIIGGVYDDRYFGFHSAGGIVLQFGEGSDTITTTDQIATGLYSHLEDDILYMIQGSAITKWNSGVTNLTMTWRSKEFTSERRQDWSCGRIVADGYNITLRLYAENVLVQTITVTSIDSFRLPVMVPRRVWSLDVQGSSAIDYVAIATSKKELSVY